jgi:hypothetical protein
MIAATTFLFLAFSACIDWDMRTILLLFIAAATWIIVVIS